MKIGIHKNEITEAIKLADEVLWYEPEEIGWSMQDTFDQSATKTHIFCDIDQLTRKAAKSISGSTHIVIMSNGSFQGFHIKLIDEIKKNLAT
jgi:UDP-N-acetylmuramate: L-alanyl-gamma-D-glutamyl-meso-diaminopimelate ligase